MLLTIQKFTYFTLLNIKKKKDRNIGIVRQAKWKTNTLKNKSRVN